MEWSSQIMMHLCPSWCLLERKTWSGSAVKERNFKSYASIKPMAFCLMNSRSSIFSHVHLNLWWDLEEATKSSRENSSPPFLGSCSPPLSSFFVARTILLGQKHTKIMWLRKKNLYAVFTWTLHQIKERALIYFFFVAPKCLVSNYSYALMLTKGSREYDSR